MMIKHIKYNVLLFNIMSDQTILSDITDINTNSSIDIEDKIIEIKSNLITELNKLNSDNLKDKVLLIDKKKELEDYKKKNIITSSAYKCPKCGERKITVTERQTRAADEPTTIYKECNVCGYITIEND